MASQPPKKQDPKQKSATGKKKKDEENELVSVTRIMLFANEYPCVYRVPKISNLKNQLTCMCLESKTQTLTFRWLLLNH